MSRTMYPWPDGRNAREAHLVATPEYPKTCSYPVSIYLNSDGSWFAAHFHGGRHDGMKHPVTKEQVVFDD